MGEMNNNVIKFTNGSIKSIFRRLLSGCLVFLWGIGLNAQSTLVQWDFSGEPGNQLFTAGTAVPAQLTPMNFIRGSGVNPTSASNSISSNGWDSGSDRYFSFGFTANSGFSVDLADLTIATRSSNTGPRDMALRYSADGFTSNLATWVQNGSAFNNQVINLSSLTGLTGSVEFRIYTTSNSRADSPGNIASGGTFRVANYSSGSVEFTGTVNTGTPSAVITTGTLSASSFTLNGCGDSTAATVNYSASGTFQAGNVFRAELSDVSGSFAFPTVVGSLSSTATSGTINFTIPPGTAAGNNYRVRVTSNNPQATGTNSTPFTVNLLNCSPTVLELGDVAVIGMNANQNACKGTSSGADEISLVFFKDINPGTEIDLTDNGYERTQSGLWGNTEGTVRLQRTGGVIPAGTVITFVNTGSTSTAWDFITPDDGWSVSNIGAPTGSLNMNSGGDQLFIMQGGTWNNGAFGSHDASYTGGRVLYGFNTKNIWSADGGTQQSNIYPGLECFNLTPSAATDYLKYTGPGSSINQRGWIARLATSSNWSSYANCASYNSAAPDYAQPAVLLLSGGFNAGQWGGWADTDWFNCLNWNDLNVPDSTVNVIVPNVANLPAIGAGDAYCRDITFQSGANLTMNTTLSKLYVAGNWLNNSGDSLNLFNGEVVFESSQPTQISGPANERFFNLTKSALNTLSLNTNINVANNLALNDGILNLNQFDLITTGFSGSGFNNQKMIVTDSTGSFVKRWSSNGSFIYPLGNTSGVNPEYSPIEVQFLTGNFNNGRLGAFVTNRKHPQNASANHYISRYWTVSDSGISNFDVRIKASFNSGDVTGSQSQLIGGLRDTPDTSWFCLNPVDSANQMIQDTITNFESGVITAGEFGPVISGLSPLTASICSTGTDTLRVDVTGGVEPFNYLWNRSFNSGPFNPLPSSNSPGLILPDTLPHGQYRFNVVIDNTNNGCGMVKSSNIQVDIEPNPKTSTILHD